jgi:hypothetical protein
MPDPTGRAVGVTGERATMTSDVLRRDELWLSLLRRLTERFPGWAVWKNVESALAGTGDVDSFAPPADWPEIQRTFVDWVVESGMGPALVCRHIPQGPHFITIQRGSPYIVQLDVKERGTFRGSTFIDAWSLLPLTEMDDRGFRRVRPGVEGVIKLCMNGVRRGGRPNAVALEKKRVRALLAADPEGVRLAAQLMGPAGPAVVRGARAVLEGRWDRRAMLLVESWAAFRSLAEPGTAVSRWRFLNITAPRCPVIHLIRECDRKMPGDPETWLRSVAAGHEWIETSVRPASSGP